MVITYLFVYAYLFIQKFYEGMTLPVLFTTYTPITLDSA